MIKKNNALKLQKIEITKLSEIHTIQGGGTTKMTTTTDNIITDEDTHSKTLPTEMDI